MNANLSASFDANSYCPLEDWSALQVEGPDAPKFLNSFCTNDLLKLEPNDSCEAFFTDVKAHILAYTTVYRESEERYFVLLSSSLADQLLTHLDRYLIREQVTLEAFVKHAMLFTNAPIQPSAETFVVPIKAYGESANVWLGSLESINNAIELLKKEDKQLLTTDEFNRIRILNGVPKDQLDVDQRNLPQEVDRVEQTISFTKGCYLGQEPVARIDALGQVNWLLRGLRFTSVNAPAAGTELHSDEKVVGRVTSSLMTERGPIGLGYVRRQVANQEKKLSFDDGQAQISALPFKED